MLNDKYGLWISNEIKFDNNYEALRHATLTHSDVTFWYHDEVFKNINKSLLGKTPLNQLYKNRAQQLRDTYNYLILYYSGGADSHNVLKTFIDNNIKLDEICVRWPKALVDKKFYNPNNKDQSSKNVWSEWDYCVVPILKWVSQHCPEIKISIKDYTPDDAHIDKLFEDQKHLGFRLGTIKENSFSDSESEMINKGKTVGNIFGIDKPLLGVSENKVYTYFLDKTLLTGSASAVNPTGAEFFYWTHNMPILFLEQAYQLFLYYKVNENSRPFLYTHDQSHNGIPVHMRSENQKEIAKKVLYTTWDNRFQAGKKEDQFGGNMYFWMLYSELAYSKENLLDNVVSRSSTIDKSLLMLGGTVNGKELYLPKFFKSCSHYIGSFDE